MAKREVLAFALIGVLGSVALLSFWLLEWRWLGRFDNSLAQFDGQNLLAVSNGRITVQQFIDPNCPCNRYVREHQKELQAHYGPQNVRFDFLTPSSLAPVSIPSSPAVAIWSGDGQLAYFGPYSNGIICNAKTSFIEPVLKQLKTGENPQITNTAGVGCFCPWPDAQSRA
ncbi:DUF6436 domain-containing protein [Pseudoteredinibacter isoporae]|uniref:DUF6436 domain-containing protein n=1 Tax=Pseudoteredinibacter isoporae TaxID=570281 RepID=A0A7X0MTZ6_9GAMM|nr:DUF6436 domain-containing protein [Pseudoteredinibacter isoporae]MBB6520081.1 hypothetical protein [Pseudoteredinibacter isoporae]NHO85653.1 thiol-disulfide isomerase [Pseudoteredinibacter isoporae]NIB25895.1 thiol-disulfide isomerase [Pseudoteredinibacter isoporae]